MTTLSKKQKKILKKSSQQAVQETFKSLGRYILKKQWMGSSNRYRVNCITSLKNDTERGNVNHLHLRQYIAASAPLHCSDGWSYLARATDSLARCDANSSRHLAYYAELRAAMSLLATEGIGIFASHHFALDLAKKCYKIPQIGTHKVAWLALEYWASLKRSEKLIAEIITPNGITLKEWLYAFGAYPNFRAVAKKWLEIWGLDLKLLGHDREARNEASYRPTCLNAQISLNAMKISNFLRNLWLIYEPSDPSRFEILDRHLLRLCLEQTYQAITGKAARDTNKDYTSRIDNMLNYLITNVHLKDLLKKFLIRKTEPNTSAIINEAKGNVSINDPHHHIQVISRASLLLRVATGACSKLLRESGINKENLEFWWQGVGKDRGLWNATDIPAEFIDLWADIEAALKEAYDWEEANDSEVSVAAWRREQTHPISTLGGCERIGLWGLGL